MALTTDLLPPQLVPARDHLPPQLGPDEGVLLNLLSVIGPRSPHERSLSPYVSAAG